MLHRQWLFYTGCFILAIISTPTPSPLWISGNESGSHRSAFLWPNYLNKLKNIKVSPPKSCHASSDYFLSSLKEEAKNTHCLFGTDDEWTTAPAVRGKKPHHKWTKYPCINSCLQQSQQKVCCFLITKRCASFPPNCISAYLYRDKASVLWSKNVWGEASFRKNYLNTYR